MSGLVLAFAAGAAGCSDASDGVSVGPTTAVTAPEHAPRAREAPKRERLTRARCAASAPAGCRSASGSILYVERVDPDGDGDAHFVLVSRESITAPGLTVVDVRRDLRPHPLPGPGDRVSAAGPVYRGSYGQRQIEAIELHVAQ